MEAGSHRSIRITLALLLPFFTCALQWQFWPVFRPFVWFLFFPTVFFSSRIGGKFVGLVSTAISALLVVYFFIPPQLSFSDKAANNLYSVALFLVMGGLFSLTHDKLEKAKCRAANALEESRVANDLLQKSNQQVTQLYEQTLKLDELKTRFFANISHELRTPLTLILGPVGRRLADPGLRNEDRNDLEVVERNARLLYRQVSDLLDVSKLEAGRMEPRYSNVDLAGLVRFVASHFESRAGENNINFSIDAPGALPAQADPEKCRRILLNLLSNAFKFTPPGGGIAVILRTSNGSALIEVRDNGPGIPVDKRELVFERFSQIDGGSERRYGGTGLGLAIVKEFTGLHGGSVKVTDAPGGGALFTVALPLTAPDGVTIHAAEAGGGELFEHLASGVGLQRSDEGASVVACDAPLILVVEDNRDMNRYISSLLARQYRVASAFDGEEGLAGARSLQPDLLISDMMMPRMSGERMVRELRRQPEMDRLPIIMLSARSDDELRVRLLENGVQDYLTKPFSDAELLARVNGLLAGRREAELALRESESSLKQAQRLAKVGSWAWNTVSDVHTWSDEVYRIYGRDPSLPPAGYPEVASYFTPESWSRLNAAVSAGLEQGVPYKCDAEVIRSDGLRCWIVARGNVERDEGGKVFRLYGTIQDITERKLAEQQIRELNAGLEQRVEERTAELLAANQELDAFAYAVSHDLRAPLRAMNGFSQALVEDFGEQLQGEARVYLEQISIASRQMGALIDGLLTLSRSTRGEMNRDLVDLTQTARQIREELLRLEPERQVAWQIEAGLVARGDAGMLAVVLRNLLGNSWKYTSGSSSPLIRVYSEARDGTRCYCIADNGAGFDMGHSQRLFKPFQRLHRQDEFPGIGIGLATVQRIVHRHGGKIDAQAEPGKGAIFRFTLGESVVPFT